MVLLRRIQFFEIRQEYWSGLPVTSPGDFPNPGTKPVFLLSSALAGGFFTTKATWEAQGIIKVEWLKVTGHPEHPRSASYSPNCSFSGMEASEHPFFPVLSSREYLKR